MSNSTAAMGPATPEYVGWQLEIFTAVFVPVQIGAVALRFYTRSIVDSPWGWDDALVFVSLLCQLVQAGIGIGAVREGGMGYHTTWLVETDPARMIVWGKYLVAISVWYFATLNLPKLAILALFHRLFRGRTPRRIVYALGTVLIGASVSITIAALAACEPFEANWNLALVETGQATCIDKEALFIWSSIPSIATDVIMLLFPLPLIWKLHTNARMKVGLTITFLVGSLGLITSVLRFTGFFQNNSFTDGTFAGVALMIWTETEPGVYLISACLPTYRPLLEKLGIGRLTANASTARGRSQGSPTYNRWAGSKYSGSSGAGSRSANRSYNEKATYGPAPTANFKLVTPPGFAMPHAKKDSFSSSESGHRESSEETVRVTTSIRVEDSKQPGDWV